MFSLFPSVLVPVLVWFLFALFEQVEFVCYVFHGEQARWRPLNLELILQRCSEVQHWVATEILQCQSLPKRIQLLRKFIKIAALWVYMCLCRVQAKSAYKGVKNELFRNRKNREHVNMWPPTYISTCSVFSNLKGARAMIAHTKRIPNRSRVTLHIALKVQ